jgi:hypothetical protein
MIAASAGSPRHGGDGCEPAGDEAREELTVREGTHAAFAGQDDRTVRAAEDRVLAHVRPTCASVNPPTVL